MPNEIDFSKLEWVEISIPDVDYTRRTLGRAPYVLQPPSEEYPDQKPEYCKCCGQQI